MQAEIKIPVSQILALFVKVIRKLSKAMQDTLKQEIAATIPDATDRTAMAPQSDGATGTASTFKPPQRVLEDELTEEGDEVTRRMREHQRELINSLDLDQ